MSSLHHLVITGSPDLVPSIVNIFHFFNCPKEPQYEVRVLHCIHDDQYHMTHRVEKHGQLQRLILVGKTVLQYFNGVETEYL